MFKQALVVFSCVVVLGLANTAQGVIIETVPVGNVGNTADTRYETPGYGAVDYTYNIGKYEVTAGQYTEFLNAVAATDTYGLYNTDMWSHSFGCKIDRSGSSASYTYSVAADWAKRPVNFVSWGDAARFANWLHNGQPIGAQDLNSTEDGAYYLNGANADAPLVAVAREADAVYVIPTEDEWYKAVYHKNDGVTGNYWRWPTNSNTEPGNDLFTPDGGNNANFWVSPSDYTIGSPYYRTETGEFENSASPYGTFDQGGNVWEWNEAIFPNVFRGVRGGSFHGSGSNLLSATRTGDYPAGGTVYIGFRVAIVPEPATLSLLAIGGLALIRRRK